MADIFNIIITQVLMAVELVDYKSILTEIFPESVVTQVYVVI